MNSTTTLVWCLIINHNHEPLGNVFEVEAGRTLASLRKAVKQEAPAKLKDVDPDDLIVLRGTDTTAIVNYDGSDDMYEQVRTAMSFGCKILPSMHKITQLAITDNEVLLIQLPGI